MKEKYTLGSPTNKYEVGESLINFKKSPIKFAIYDSLNKPKEIDYKGGSSHNSPKYDFDSIKKISSEQSNLRQTLSYTSSDFQYWMNDDVQKDKDKGSKAANILRQTLTNKSNFKPKSDKSYSQSYS